MEKKLVALLSVMLVALMLFAACGSDGNETSSQPADSSSADSSESDEGGSQTGDGEAVHLTIWLAGSGDGTMDQAYKTVCNNYVSANPNVTYEITYIAWGDYFTKLNTGLIGGAGPDIFMTGYGQFGTVQASGDLLPLNDYIPDDWDGYEDIKENILGATMLDGVQYGIFTPASRVFMYRKDIAEQNGVTEEDLHITSFDDFANLVRKLTVYDDAGNVEVYGYEVDPDGEQDFYMMTSMFYGGEFTFWDENYDPCFNIPEAVEAWEAIYALYEEGVVCMRDAAATSIGVQSGIAAMAVTAEASYGTFDDAFPGQIGIARNDNNALLIGNYVAVNNATKHPEQAVDMLIYMHNVESSEIMAEVMGQYSGRTSCDDHYISLNPEYENTVYAYEHSYLFGKPLYQNYNAAIQNLRTALESVFHGTSASDAFAEATTAWEAVNAG